MVPQQKTRTVSEIKWQNGQNTVSSQWKQNTHNRLYGQVVHSDAMLSFTNACI